LLTYLICSVVRISDIEIQNSFDKAKEWVKELQSQGDPNVVVAFVGNKIDMEPARKVNSEVMNS
jgi:Ras-related protein Rab-5C